MHAADKDKTQPPLLAEAGARRVSNEKARRLGGYQLACPVDERDLKAGTPEVSCQRRSVGAIVDSTLHVPIADEGV